MSPAELKYFGLELEKEASLRSMWVLGRRHVIRPTIRTAKETAEGFGRWYRGKTWSKPKPPPSQLQERVGAIKGGLFTLGAAGAIGVGGIGYGALTQPKSIREQRQF